MKELKKIKVDDLVKKANLDYGAVYNALKSKLGDDMPLAIHHIGSGFYTWESEQTDWECVSEADDMLCTDIKAALADALSKVQSVMENSEKILLYPDESYVFYRYGEDNTIRVLLTGWGFEKPVHRVGGPLETHMPQKQEIRVAFCQDEKPVPNRNFSIRLPRSQKLLSTGSTGFCLFPPLKVGSVYQLMDLETQSEYTLHVEEGKMEYRFDLPIPPVEEELPIEVPPVTPEPPVVLPPAPEVRPYHILLLDTDGIGVPRTELTILQGDMCLNLTTDEQGGVEIDEQLLTPDVQCDVSIPSTNDTISIVPTSDERDYELQYRPYITSQWRYILSIVCTLLAIILLLVLAYFYGQYGNNWGMGFSL